MAMDKTLHNMDHSGSDPAQAVLDSVGYLDEVDVFGYQILVGSYIRPEKTAGGLIQIEENRDEDKWQGKVHLILKIGPQAAESMELVKDEVYGSRIPEVGDWVVLRVHDGTLISVNGHECRLIEDKHLRMRVKNPDSVL